MIDGLIYDKFLILFSEKHGKIPTGEHLLNFKNSLRLAK